MSEGSSPKRPRLDDDSGKDDHHDKYSKIRDQDDQGSYSNPRKRRGDTDDDDMKECDEMKSKNVGGDAGRREHTLVMRLTNKEQELQECMNQIQEMKQAQTQNTAQLRSMLLDPAINLVFQRMSKEMEEHKEKLKQKQNELNAWKFTPDSQTGMRLMGKCRMLLQENGELGKMISSGRTARLEGEISLHKALVAEMKKNQKELDEFVGELEEDVEGMQGMIFMLQQQLKEAREQISRLQQENEQLRTLQLPTEPEPGGVDKNGLDAGENIMGHSPPTSQCVNSSFSLSVHPETKPPTSSLVVPSTLIPQSYSNDSATDDLSPASFSLKVTPDSGIQTQEEDTTDSLSVDDCPPSQPDLEPHSTANTPGNPLGDGVQTLSSNENGDNLKRTSADDDNENENVEESTANLSVPNSCVHERTSPTAAFVTNTNGDIPVTANEDSQSSIVEVEPEEARTPTGEEVKGLSDDDDRTEGGDQLDLKLTHSSDEKGLGLKQEAPVVNSCELNLTNGSSDTVTTVTTVPETE